MEKFLIAISIVFLLLLLLAIIVWIISEVVTSKYNKVASICSKDKVPLVKVDDSDSQRKVVKVYKNQVKLEDTLEK